MNYPAKLKKPHKIFLCGSEGCGKGHQAKILARAETRLVVWDTPADWEPARTKIAGDLLQLKSVLMRPHFRVAFRPNIYDLKNQFDEFNKIVFAIGRMMAVYDELNAVTMPSHTPASFMNMTSRSRHRGIKMLGMTQRPAETGKSFYSNATEIYAGNLSEPADLAPLRARAGQSFIADLPNMPLRKLKHWKRPE